jgi:2,4-dienoyl-CoA reductase (NADPH2)
MAWPHLLSPGRIGNLELKNRILMTPMGTNQEQADGHLGEPILRYYEERARGGAGCIIAGVAAITWPDGACNPHQAAISDDRFLPDWQEFARRCHAHGAKAAVQLQHASKVAQEDMVAGRPMWVPSVPKLRAGDLYDELTPEELASATSAFRQPGAKIAYREMDEADMAFIVTRFADAAERVKAAGCDAVELHAGHGYMLSAFLSPKSNRRTDDWGGSVENRARLLVEVIRAVRERVGDGLALWCRLDAKEFRVEGGIAEDDARRTAELAAAAGLDAIHVSAYADPMSAIGFTDAPLVHRPAGYLELAAAIRKRVDVPVIAVGRIEPDVAESAIAAGRIDFVAMGRKLLADPTLPRRLAEGRAEDARPCIYAYQCVGNVFLRQTSRCVVNAEMGREQELALEPATAPRAITVVGGGPAGLEAARVAAQRGHRVVLLEREEALGGRTRVGAAIDPEMALFVAWNERTVRAAGVEVRLGVEARAADLVGSADAFVVATGGRRAPAPGSRVRAVEELPALLGEAPTSVLIDASDAIGVKAAEALAEAGFAVTLLQREGEGFGPQLGLPRRWRAADLLKRLGVTRLRGVTAVRETASGIEVEREGAFEPVAATCVLQASGLGPWSPLADALEAGGAEVHRIGDCARIGYLAAAIRGGAELGRAL